jgi:hypothetical protein
MDAADDGDDVTDVPIANADAATYESPTETAHGQHNATGVYFFLFAVELIMEINSFNNGKVVFF